jgi:hypothetical protein
VARRPLDSFCPPSSCAGPHHRATTTLREAKLSWHADVSEFRVSACDAVKYREQDFPLCALHKIATRGAILARILCMLDTLQAYSLKS